MAKRAERLTMLRRLALLYETRLADVDGVVYASSAVLELLAGDRDALERMERVLEKAGDPRLEQTLEYHAAASTSPAERAKLLKRLAKLAVARQDDALVDRLAANNLERIRELADRNRVRERAIAYYDRVAEMARSA